MKIKEAFERLNELEAEMLSLWKEDMDCDVRERLHEIEKEITQLRTKGAQTEQATMVSIDCGGEIVTKSLADWAEGSWWVFNCNWFDIKRAVWNARANTELVE